MLITLDGPTMTMGSAKKIWFTGDHHLGHANIIKYCKRPFSDVGEMDYLLIEYWNRLVKPDDIVFYLGDFTLGGLEDARKYFCQLNGKIGVLRNPWHHDRRWLPSETKTDWGTDDKIYTNYSGVHIDILPPMVVLEFDTGARHKQTIVLCHYPLAEWDRKHHGAWHLHGHSHGNHKGEGLIFDVGVDVNGFAPVSLYGIAERVADYYRQHDPHLPTPGDDTE